MENTPDAVDDRLDAEAIDHDIRQEVIAELDWDPRTRSSAIGVSSKNGVVTLTGWVTALGHRWAAEEVAHRVRGVRAVANDIEVRLPIDSERTDPEIAIAALRALDANAVLDALDIEVTVSAGVITLRGTVDWNHQKQDAELAVRDLWGVRDVANLLTVRARTSPVEVRREVETALRRTIEIDASAIEVETRDGTVVLRGTVRSWAEREAAERVAWTTGVTAIANELVVTS